MEIAQTILEKDVVDYDFALAYGVQFKPTLDPAAGDVCEETDASYKIFLAEKPSPIDPEVKMPAQLIVINKPHILAIVVSKRKQRLPTEEEKFDMRKLLHDLPKTVQ